VTLAAARALCLLLATAAVVALAAPGAARAQPPAYAATPPTKGALYFDGQTNRYLLGGAWLYRADLGDVGRAQGWWRNVAATDGWSTVTIPNAYNAGDFSSSGMRGYVGWYRRDFTLPAGAFASYVPPSGRHWIIRFESVNYSATVWLNGQLIGTHTGENLPFELDLRRLHGGVNRLVVRVDDRRSPSDLPPGPGPVWGNSGGLLREVYLRAAQVADLAQVQVRPLLPCPRCPATIDEQVLVHNETGARQTVRLVGSYGKARLDFGHAVIAPHGTWVAQATVGIARPRLWAPGSPYLYLANLRLSDALGRTLGGYSAYSGIRSITVTSGGRLAVNGRLVSLRGVELREQNVKTGAALDPTQLGQLMSWARALGATVIRSDPLNPALEELADRDGILIWSEIPVSQLVANSFLDQPAWVARAHMQLENNILTNQNHPSILLWSIGNELPTPATAAETSYIADAAALAHRLDPTRPVGMAIADWPGLPCQQAYAPLDVIGFNEYFGWFDAGGGATDDRDALSPFLDSYRACYPHKALFVSEFGFDGNRNGPIEERGTYQFQSDAAAFHLGVFATKPWLSGVTYFLLQDAVASPGYQGGNPWPDPPFNEKGLVDLYGALKPAFATVASIYKATTQIMPVARPTRPRRAG
jgi:beta-glucuronidase